MENRNLNSQLQKLDALFKKVNVLCGDDIEAQSHWAKYLCVLCAGFLENAIYEIYGEFVTGASSQPVAKYSKSILFKIQNPKASKFIEIASGFKKDWGSQLEVFLADKYRSYK